MSDNRTQNRARTLESAAGWATAGWSAWTLLRLAFHFYGPAPEDRFPGLFFAPFFQAARSVAFSGVCETLFFLVKAPFFLFAMTSMGLLALARLKVNCGARIETLCFSFLLGSGFWALSIALFNSQRFVRPGAWLALLIVTALASLPRWAGLMRQKDSAPSPEGRWFWIGLAALTAFPLLGNMAPASDVDSLMYHLQLPKLYLREGGFRYFPWMLHGLWPQNMEMLYELGMGVTGGGERLARIVHFAMGAALAVSLYAFGKRHLTPAAGALGGLLFLAAPVVSFELSTSYNELGLAFYEWMAVFAFVNRMRSKERGWLTVSAIAAGLGCGVKYTGGAAPALILAGWAVLAVRKEPGVPSFKEALQFVFLTALLAAPWHVRAWIEGGDPIWPFGWPLFHGRNWSELNARDYAFYLTEGHGARGWASLLRFPVRGAYGLWEDSLGLLVLGAAPALALLPLSPRVCRNLAAYSALFFFIWFCLSQQTRFLIPGLAVWSLVVSSLLLKPRGGARAALAACGALLAAVTIWLQCLRFLPVVPPTIGGLARERYLERFSFYNAAQCINEKAPAEGKVLLLWDSRGYYIDREVVWGDPLDQGFLRPWEFSTPEDYEEKLDGLGVTHALFHVAGLQNKARLDAKLRSSLGLTVDDPTVIASILHIQNALIESGAWTKECQSGDGSYYVFRRSFGSSMPRP